MVSLHLVAELHMFYMYIKLFNMLDIANMHKPLTPCCLKCQIYVQHISDAKTLYTFEAERKEQVKSITLSIPN